MIPAPTADFTMSLTQVLVLTPGKPTRGFHNRHTSQRGRVSICDDSEDR
jgi:hypothetical protein